jgi:glycosyltransferase involved in cell wall biosynthesis
MNLSNQLALLMGKLRNACIVWGKRNLFRSGFTSNWLPLLTRHLGVSLASYADLIIVNSHAGYHSLIEHGYPAERMTVISNGIDVDYFKPVEGKRLINMCRKWGVTSEDIIIGLAGRIVPRKGHATFLRAAEKLSSIYPDVHFVCIGGGKDGYLAKLRSLSQQLGVEKRVTWAGLETDMPAVYGALDVATNATHSHEGFSNVIGEAMACEVPCVVTDVGDSAFVVGSSGIVVPSQDPAALAQAWERLLNMPVERREELGVVARKRIVQEFSVPILVDRTTEVLEELVMSLDQ